MSLNTRTPIGPMDLAAAAFSLPLFSLVLAALIVVCALFLGRLRQRHGGPEAPSGTPLPAVPARYRPEHRAFGIGAIAVIVVYAAENIVRGYLLNLVDIVEWWQYATPVFAAVLCLAVGLALIVVRGNPKPEQPVVPTARRTSLSFGPRAGLFGGAVALVALLATTIAAGLASSADERGRFIYLEITVPNTQLEPLRPWFYGWDFGVPVLICLAALVLVTWATLRSNALRPYLRPETVTAERTARAQVASGAVAITTAATLLALGGAFRFIGRYGSMSQLTVGNDGAGTTYDMTWQYAEFAAAAHWLAPALEITGFALLLFVAIRLLRRPAPERQHPRPQPSTQPETVR
ncbi:hypothetical protein E3O42_09795 [Cryobacterium adonitolivorans]|uniref:Uncharacterized protein n=1 Tax=Cryobacterium adonitolivorans TaxID=1259189 RepID=A0A4R8W6U0_9MICO|nr:hypothetical protein [Cryobacterium adonitolivorans]TFC01655.1 hypothetical protein E3O42_09795 [Cryobacterium adonitolivorans]